MNKKSFNGKTRKLMRLGKFSLVVGLPKEIISELGWKEKQKVAVKKRGKSIVIEDWKG